MHIDVVYFFFFFKQKTAYEMRISDWGSDVCSSDLHAIDRAQILAPYALVAAVQPAHHHGGGRGPAQHRQDGPRVLVDTDQLAVDRRQRERDKRPSTPAHPFGYGAAPPMLAGPFGQHAFRAEPATPGTPQQRHGGSEEHTSE